MSLPKNSVEPIYVIDGVRTPFMRAKGPRGPWSAADLGVYAARALFMKSVIPPQAVDQVIAACVNPSEDEANIARIMGLRLGCGIDVPGYTVARNCGAGLQAIDNAIQSLQLGLSDCSLVIGTEVMSRAPLICPPLVADWLSAGAACKTTWQKMKWLSQIPLRSLSPIISLKQGLTDPTNGLIMGKTAQEIAYHFDIAREEMDRFAVASHQKAHYAWENNQMTEVIPLITDKGTIIRDDGIRADNSLQKLAQLKPVFEPYGSITAGNSSQITDGAGCLLLATESFIKKYQIQPMGIIRSVRWTGCDPKMMGLGPVQAMSRILIENQLHFEDIDLIEINEAFAAQVLGVMKSFSDPVLGAQYCGIDDRFGPFPEEKLNIWGGAIALGHPIAASGIRLVLRALNGLRSQGKKRALVSLCIGGGQGGAALVESV
ncbi:MAG: acetyl-CoA C-acyltransferase [Gammaproteobacteria bacterium]|nr:acetyl-CoA C-acyltransferase [Gammaproteobacteria bacterium]